MPELEDLLPENNQFGETLREYRDILFDVLQADADAGDIIAPEFEIRLPQLRSLSMHYASTMRSEGEDTEGVAGAAYRGFAIGYRIAEQLSAGPLGSLSLRYLSEQEEETIRDRICEDVSTYLSSRPLLDALLSRFMPEIDRTYLYDHHVETSAGLILMLAERQEAEQYLLAEAESLDITQFSNPNIEP